MTATPHDVLRDPGYGALKHYIIQTTGLSYYQDKDPELAAAIVRALDGERWDSAGKYLTRISREKSPELDRLTEELTIGETFFFRHAEMFTALRTHVFPEIHRRNASHRQIRIWSAGCSIGAEPYSLSIMLRTELAHLFGGWDVGIFGTDINRRFLEMAREGKFADWALRGMPEDQRRRCFDRRGKEWVLQRRFTEGVTFQHHNLVRDRFPSLANNLFAFDLVICRNVMIYFSTDTVRRLAEQFHQTLVPGGWLAVGHAEPHIEIFKAFQTVNTPGAVLYHRARAGSPIQRQAPPEPVQWSPPETPLSPASREVPAPVPKPVQPMGVSPTGSCLNQESIRSLADSGDFQEALRCCRNLLARERFDVGLHLTHALLREQMDDLDGALEALRRALYLDRTLALAHYHAGLIHKRAGRQQEAARSWRNARESVAGLGEEIEIRHGDGLTVNDLLSLIAQQAGELG